MAPMAVHFFFLMLGISKDDEGHDDRTFFFYMLLNKSY